MPTGTTCRVFFFGAFEVDEASGEVRKQGVRVKLHSQPFQVLVMLLEKPSELVTREEIRQRLWGDGTHVDFDHGLNTAVNKVRQVLFDSAAEPKYVETIPGKGYRFIGSVITKTAEPVSATPEPAKRQVLAAPRDLPAAPRVLVLTLLLLCQAMYLAFYLGALANLPEVREIIDDARLPAPALLFAMLVTSAAVLIPVRLFLGAALAFDLKALPAKFGTLFPVLLCVDLLWALSPFLLVHHISTGLAIGLSAALVYLPFAQRSMILMYARGR